MASSSSTATSEVASIDATARSDAPTALTVAAFVGLEVARAAKDGEPS